MAVSWDDILVFLLWVGKGLALGLLAIVLWVIKVTHKEHTEMYLKYVGNEAILPLSQSQRERRSREFEELVKKHTELTEKYSELNNKYELMFMRLKGIDENLTTMNKILLKLLKNKKN